MKVYKEERDQAVEWLTKNLKDKTVFCIIRRVSKSGMSRVISCHVIDNDSVTGQFSLNISHAAHLVTGHTWVKDEMGIRINGCGMDMVFALIDDLSHAVYGKSNMVKFDTL